MNLRAVIAAAAACAAIVAGCGEEDDPAAGAKPVGPQTAGSVVQYADCDDWRGGTVAERHATIDELRSQLTLQESKSTESPLADDRAYDILDKSCQSQNSGSLRLYKLYVRAQGFAPLQPES